MKRLLALLLIALSLFALTACTDGPLVATATPSPTPTPEPTATPAPTPTPLRFENVVWPEEASMTKLAPFFASTLTVASQKGDTSFFVAFEEYEPLYIEEYTKQLKAAGYSVVEQEMDGLIVLAHKDYDGALKVQLFYDNSSSGTIQITDKRESKTPIEMPE